MAENKSIMDDILNTITDVESTVNENAQEILRSTMNEEIDQILDASVNEADAEDEDDVTDEVIDAEGSEDNEEIEIDADADIDGESEDEEVEDVEADEVADSIDSAIEGGDEGTEEVADVDYEAGMDMEVSDIADIDLTGADDEEIIKVFKKLTDEDEIEVVSDKEVKITEPTTGTEYKVEMGGEDTEEVIDDIIGDEIGELSIEDEVEDEMVYEIELDESLEESIVSEEEEVVAESEEEVVTEEVEEEDESEEIEETTRTLGGGDETKGGLPKQKGSKSPAMKEDFEAKYNELLESNKTLKAENAEIKEAVKKLRGAFKETAVFSSNLAHATKLFTENSTNKAEKQDILKRFDEVASLDDSKKLYRVIKEELSKTNVSEKVEDKLTESATTSTSSKLNESRAYVDQSTKNIIDLMKRVG